MSRVTRILIAAGLLCGVSGVAQAGIAKDDVFEIPVGFSMNLSWGTSGSWNLVPEAITDIQNGGDSIVMTINWSNSNWSLSNMVVEIPVDGSGYRGVTPVFINSSFNLTNNQAATQTFVVSVSQNGVGPIGPTTTIFGSNSGNVGDGPNLNGATLGTNLGQSFYEALIDGTPVRTLFDHPQSVVAGIGQTNAYGPGNFGPEGSIGLINSVGITNRFTLTPGDNAGMTSTFILIPAPGAAGLLGLAGLAVLRRRR